MTARYTLCTVLCLSLCATGGCALDISGEYEPGPDTGQPDTEDAADTFTTDMGDVPVDTWVEDTALDTSPDGEDVIEDPGDVMPDCDGPTSLYYIDADGDGFGDIGGGLEWCAPPPGFVTNHDDCLDTNPQVYPGQPDYFPVPRLDGSFDYDCDMVETVRWTATTTCDWGRCSGEGWFDSIPACGVAAQWRRCDWWVVWCDVVNTDRQQMCK